MQTIRGALDDLGRDVRVIGISVDPANDKPKRAESFLLKQQHDGPDGLPARQPRRARADLEGVRDPAADDRLEHSAHTVLADARGMQRVGFPFDHLTEEGLAHDLARL